ncbi:MAG: hypothetical protein AABY33_02810 [Pseudomonadota bacterium]
MGDTLKTIGVTVLSGALGAGGDVIDNKLKVPVPEFKEHACEAPIKHLIETEIPTYKQPPLDLTGGASSKKSDSDTLAEIGRQDAVKGKTAGIIDEVRKVEEGRSKQVNAAEDHNNNHYGMYIGAGAVPAGLAVKGVAGWIARNREEREAVAAASQGRGVSISG